MTKEKEGKLEAIFRGFPKLSAFLLFFGGLTSVLSFMRWFDKDPSQLVFGVGIGFFIMFVGYFIWHTKAQSEKRKREKEESKKEIEDLKKDVQAVDKNLNSLENSFIGHINKK